jgi:hypothetical protein
MFIRWKRRKKAEPKQGRLPRRRSRFGDSLYCVLVESLRVSGGPPRQKVICYLGSVDEGDRERLCVRVNFWDRLRRCLDQLQIDAPERTKIEASIERVVSRAAEDEAAQFRVDRDKYRKFMRSIRPPVVMKSVRPYFWQWERTQNSQKKIFCLTRIINRALHPLTLCWRASARPVLPI